jgi:hypothetical protein
MESCTTCQKGEAVGVVLEGEGFVCGGSRCNVVLSAVQYNTVQLCLLQQFKSCYLYTCMYVHVVHL